MVDVQGNNHNLIFHRTDGPLDSDEERAIVVTGNNSTIVNETEYAIILESGTSGNVVTSCGPVTDNGSNSVTNSSNCNFSCGDFDAFSTIEAESYCDMSGIETEATSDTGGGSNVGYIDTGDWINFDDVDFDNGAESVDVRVASNTTGGSIEFRLGSTSGTLLGTATVPVTGGWQSWQTVSANISGASGTQDLYLVFAGNINVNWFVFTESTNGTVPEAGKTYYISSDRWNLRLGANGGEDAYTTSSSTTGSNVEWTISQSPTSDYYYIDCVGGGAAPRIRTDRTENADMQATSSAGSYTKWAFTSNGDGTYLLTTLDQVLPRLQINSAGEVKMVTTASTGSWESFTFTEVGSSCASFSTIQAEGFDNMSGVVDEGSNIGNVHNGDWIMFDDVDLTCAASIGVRASSRSNSGNVEIRLGSTTGTLVGTASVSTTGDWGTYVTTSASISGASGVHDLYLVFTGGSSYLFNLDWVLFGDNASARQSGVSTDEAELETQISVFPNPVLDVLNVTLNKSDFNQFALYNVNGKVVQQGSIVHDLKELTIDFNSVQRGVYILTLSGNGATFRKKIIKN